MTTGERMSKGLDFMLKGVGPKNKTPESGSTETKAESPEDSIDTQESRVTTQETEFLKHEPSIKTQESGIGSRESPDTSRSGENRLRSRRNIKKSRVVTHESSVVSDEIIDMAVTQALQSPKISLYSPLLLAVLESQQLSLLNRKEMTLLHYRKATKARELVEKALVEAYPELCEKILKRINEGNGKS